MRVFLSAWQEYALWVVVVLAGIAAFAGFTVDDAFISFRYGHNLVRHGIWNWNPDGDRVEAYTSALYAVLAIIPQWLNISLLLFFKLLGLIFMGCFVWRLRSFCEDSRTRFLLTLFVLANPYIYVHVFSCLETPLFLLLLLEIFAFTSGRRRHVRWFYSLLILLPLTRPEGAIISGLALGQYLFQCRGRPAHPAFLIGSVTAGGAYFFWRYTYFGYLLPNTFYAKHDESLSPFSAITQMFEAWPYLLAILLLSLWVRDRQFRPIALFSLLVYAVTYIPSVLWMNYADRFFLQLFLPVIVLGVTFISKDKILRVGVLLALLLVIAYGNVSGLEWLFTYRGRALYAEEAIGKLMSGFNGQHSWMIGDAGAGPYQAGWKAYDSLGLADNTIAHQGNSIAYMNMIRPDVIVLHTVHSDPALLQQDIFHDLKRFRQQPIYNFIQSAHTYDMVAAIKRQDDYYDMVFINKSLDDYARLKAAFIAVSTVAEVLNSRSLWDIGRLRLSYF